MRDKLLFLLKYYLFWIVFSWVAKVVFLIRSLLPDMIT